MRCVHCGKEVRNGLVFCVHCGRPIKREYAHYACEFYDSVSIRDRIHYIFTSLFGFGKNQMEWKRVDHRSIQKITPETIKDKVGTAKNSYLKYVKTLNTNSSTHLSGNNQINIDDLVEKGKNLLKFLSQ